MSQLDRGHFPAKAQLATISSESFTIELKPVVRDQCVRNSKSGDNVFPNKLLCVLISNIREGLSLDPFCKVISSDKEPSSISRCPWERTNYI